MKEVNYLWDQILKAIDWRPLAYLISIFASNWRDLELLCHTWVLPEALYHSCTFQTVHWLARKYDIGCFVPWEFENLKQHSFMIDCYIVLHIPKAVIQIPEKKDFLSGVFLLGDRSLGRPFF